jgi:hypothetical protein
LAGQEKKIYSDLTFSQYNHIQNFEEKKLFQHFANLIKIRSTRLLPILDLIIPPAPEGGGGYTVLPLSVRPSKIFFVTFFKTSKSPHAFALCSIRTNLLKQENEKIASFVDLSRLQFTPDESEFIPAYI